MLNKYFCKRSFLQNSKAWNCVIITFKWSAQILYYCWKATGALIMWYSQTQLHSKCLPRLDMMCIQFVNWSVPYFLNIIIHSYILIMSWYTFWDRYVVLVLVSRNFEQHGVWNRSFRNAEIAVFFLYIVLVLSQARVQQWTKRLADDDDDFSSVLRHTVSKH